MATPMIISADSHVNEPGDLWVERLGKQYRARAPHIVRNAGSIPGDYIIIEDLPPIHMSQGVGAGRRGQEFVDLMMNLDYRRDIRPGGIDPAERLKDMDVDGLSTEVLIPTIAGRFFSMRNAELQRACLSVYNDWIVGFCSHAPNRLIGSACISLFDAREAAREVERCVRMGLKVLVIWHTPPPELPFTSPHYDPFWAAAQDADVPVCLHVLTGFADSQSASPVDVLSRFGRMAVAADVPEMSLLPPPAEMYVRSAMAGLQVNIQRSLYQIIFSGVLERFPRLKILAAEWECDWLPLFLRRADRAFEKNRVAYPTPLTMKPSEYFQRQVWATFTHDEQGVRFRDEIGVDRMMWGSDFPHNDSTWPHSREVLDRLFEGVPDDVRARMTSENCIDLLRLEVN